MNPYPAATTSSVKAQTLIRFIAARLYHDPLQR